MSFRWRLKVNSESHDRTLDGKPFQTVGAATEKARAASAVCGRGTVTYHTILSHVLYQGWQVSAKGGLNHGLNRLKPVRQ